MCARTVAAGCSGTATSATAHRVADATGTAQTCAANSTTVRYACRVSGCGSADPARGETPSEFSAGSVFGCPAPDCEHTDSVAGGESVETNSGGTARANAGASFGDYTPCSTANADFASRFAGKTIIQPGVCAADPARAKCATQGHAPGGGHTL